jgi:hypothetical protein
MNFIFAVFPIIWVVMFVFIFGMIIMTFAKNIKQERKKDHSPRLTVPATVIAKRDQVSVHHHDHHRHTSTRYFVTFQVESGDRMELSLSGTEFGMLIEGDQGQLTFQGTRFLSFDRG